MKKFVLIAALLAFGFTTQAQTETVDIKTSAICGMCKKAIERELAYEKGVKTAKLDLKTKVVTVEYDPAKTSPDKIKERITLTGYNADTMERNAKAYDKLPDCCKDGAHEDGH